MRSVRAFRILSFSVCLLALSGFALVSCGGGDEPGQIPLSITTPTNIEISATTMLTQVSAPEFPGFMEVQVPDVVGMYCEDAWDALDTVFLAWHWTGSDPTPDASIWLYVLEQDPPAGETVPMFTTVELLGGEPGFFVPDVVGMAEMDALWYINWGNLTSAVSYVTTADSADWGIVIAQDPAPGTLWGHWIPVELDVGAQGPVTTLPNILSTTTTTLPSRGSPTTTTTLSSRGG